MLSLKKVWPFTLAALVVIGISLSVLLRGNEPVSPQKTYKATRAPNPNKNVGAAEHTHEQADDTVSHPAHTHQENLPSGEDDDWRDDRGVSFSLPEEDPWQQTYAPKTDVESSDSEDDETYPPPDWYKTTDPALYVEYYRAQLIKQFGDIPQVHILADSKRKIRAEIPMTLDEHIEQNQALYDLWPSEETQKTLEMFKEWKASGRPFVHKYGEPKPVDQFLDVKPFVDQYGLEEGIRRFRAVNPERAAEFERVLSEDRQ